MSQNTGQNPAIGDRLDRPTQVGWRYLLVRQVIAMRTRVLLAITLGLAASSLVWSGESGKNSVAAIDPTSLGSLDALLNICRDADPAGAGAYTALKVTLIGKQSDAALDAVERTAVYRQTYAGIRDILGAQPRDWLLDRCRKAINGASGAPPRQR